MKPQSSGIRRLSVLLLVSLILASASNLAVAWTFGRLMWKRSASPRTANLDFGADRVNIGGYESVGAASFFWQPATAQNWYFSAERLDENKNPRKRPPEPALARPWNTQALPNWVPAWTGFNELQSTTRRVEEVWSSAQGWPFLSFSCSYFDGCLWGKPFRLTYTVEGGIPLENKIDRYRGGGATFHYSALAFKPIWPGFLGNTAFYTLLWLGVLYVCGTGRTWWPAPGLCPVCGYDLQGLQHSVCPECGRSLHPTPLSP